MIGVRVCIANRERERTDTWDDLLHFATRENLRRLIIRGLPREHSGLVVLFGIRLRALVKRWLLSKCGAGDNHSMMIEQVLRQGQEQQEVGKNWHWRLERNWKHGQGTEALEKTPSCQRAGRKQQIQWRSNSEEGGLTVCEWCWCCCVAGLCVNIVIIVVKQLNNLRDGGLNWWRCKKRRGCRNGGRRKIIQLKYQKYWGHTLGWIFEIWFEEWQKQRVEMKLRVREVGHEHAWSTFNKA